VVSNSNALGVGTLVFEAATSTLVNNGAATFSNPTSVLGNMAFNSTNSAGTLSLTGPMTLFASSTITVSNSVSISGNITDLNAFRSLTVNGLGTLSLSGSNTIEGGITASMVTGALNGINGGAGELNIGSSGALGSSTLTITGGYLGVNAVISNPITITSGSTLNIVSAGAETIS